MRGKFSLREKDLGLRALVKTLQGIKKAYVKVGVLGGSKKSRRRGEAVSNVDLALIHEFGTSNIPERSFVRSTFEAKKGECTALAKSLVKQIYESKTTPKNALGLLGAKLAADMKSTIVAGIAPPTSPETTARKQAKTYKGAAPGEPVPLVDTGQLLSSITWAVAGLLGDKK